MAGDWRGEYELGAGYSADRPPVPFSMRLRGGWLWWSRGFRGTVNDDPVLGMPDEGRIRGEIHGTHVEFAKEMPVGYVVMPDGRRITMRAHVIASGGQDPGTIPHPKLLDSGDFDEASRRITGTWRFEEDGVGSGAFWMVRREA